MAAGVVEVVSPAATRGRAACGETRSGATAMLGPLRHARTTQVREVLQPQGHDPRRTVFHGNSV